MAGALRASGACLNVDTVFEGVHCLMTVVAAAWLSMWFRPLLGGASHICSFMMSALFLKYSGPPSLVLPLRRAHQACYVIAAWWCSAVTTVESERLESPRLPSDSVVKQQRNGRKHRPRGGIPDQFADKPERAWAPDVSHSLLEFLQEEHRAGRNNISDYDLTSEAGESLSLSHAAECTVRVTLRMLTLVVLLLLVALPTAAAGQPMGAAHNVVQSAGSVNYMAANTQQSERARLEWLRRQPHNPEHLRKQFAHDMDAYIPDGVRTSVPPEDHWLDPETELVHHRLPHVSEEDFHKLVSVTRAYATDTVAYTLDQITGYEGSEPAMEIDLSVTNRIFLPARRNYSPAELEICDAKVDELESAGTVTQRQHSRYACNAVLAAKRAPNGTWTDKRFCINFVPINKFTELDCYGSHKADDLFQRVSKKKFFTALDLRSGFHQIPMAANSVEKTSFWHVSARNQPPRLMSYNRMPFGLKNASAKFQRVMDTELQRSGCDHFAFAYIDDLLIASDSWDEHVEHVAKVLQMLKECKLRIHPGKSFFGTNVVEYLGHNVVG